MTISTYQETKWTLNQVLEAIRTLSQSEQHQLQDAIREFSDIHLISPNNSREAQESGRYLAKQIRAELKTTTQNTLDDTMASLRGRAWLL